MQDEVLQEQSERMGLIEREKETDMLVITMCSVHQK